jgi:hypothetical protein
MFLLFAIICLPYASLATFTYLNLKYVSVINALFLLILVQHDNIVIPILLSLVMVIYKYKNLELKSLINQYGLDSKH